MPSNMFGCCVLGRKKGGDGGVYEVKCPPNQNVASPSTATSDDVAATAPTLSQTTFHSQQPPADNQPTSSSTPELVKNSTPTHQMTANKESSRSLREKNNGNLEKALLNSHFLNPTALKLLQGQALNDINLQTRCVRLNVYGMPNCSIFNWVFNASILPSLERMCNENGYELEVIDQTSNLDATSAVFYDEHYNYQDLVDCHAYKRGPYRYFNLIVIPDSFNGETSGCRVLAPIFEKAHFDTLINLSLSDDERKLLKESFIEIENCFYRLKNGLSFEKRSQVIATVYEILDKQAPVEMQEKYNGCSTFEQIVTHLFAQSIGVRETTCVLCLTADDSTSSTDAATSSQSSQQTPSPDCCKLKTLANSIRAQLPFSSFIEMSHQHFKSSNGQQVCGVLQTVLQSFCEKYDRLNYVPDSLPSHLHNELLTHNNRLHQLQKYSHQVQMAISQDENLKQRGGLIKYNQFITCLQSKSEFERQMLFANELKRFEERSSLNDAADTKFLTIFRFLLSSPLTFSLESFLYSIKQQLCFISGKHPSNLSDRDIVQLLKDLLALTPDCSILIAVDNVQDDISWIPSEDQFGGRVQFLITCSAALHSTTLEALPNRKNCELVKIDLRQDDRGDTGTNLEMTVLKDRFHSFLSQVDADFVSCDTETTNERSFLNSVIKLFTDGYFHKSCLIALKHIANNPLTFSQGELRSALSTEERIGHSLAVEALYILLSPLVFKVYTLTSIDYCIVPSYFSQKVSQVETSLPLQISYTLQTESIAKQLKHFMALSRSGIDFKNNAKFTQQTFPNVLGLKLNESDPSNVLPELGDLLEQVTPLVFLEYLKLQGHGCYEEDYELFCDCVKSCLYSLSLVAKITYTSEFHRFFFSKSQEGLLKEDAHPFCWKIYQLLSKSEKVAELFCRADDMQQGGEEGDTMKNSSTMRPRKIKIISWLNAEGSEDFIIVLLENQLPPPSIEGSDQRGVAANADGKSVVAAKGRIDIVRIADLKTVRKIDMSKRPVDVKHIDLTTCVVNAERILKAIDLDNGTQKVQLKSQLNIDYPCFGIQSEDLVVFMSRNKMYVNGVSLADNTTKFNFKVGEDRFLNSLLVSPDGAYCACGDTVQKPMPLLIWDLKKQVLIHDIRIQDREFDMQLAMVSNHYIAVVVKHVTPDSLNFVNVYEFASSYNKYKFHEDASITSLLLTADERSLILGLADCSVVIHYLGSSNLPIYLNGIHKTPVDFMRCNLDASIVLTCSLKHPFADRTINLFSVFNGSLLGSFTPHARHFTCVEISPVGHSFFFGTNENCDIVKVTFNTATSSKLPKLDAVFGSSENEGKHSSI